MNNAFDMPPWTYTDDPLLGALASNHATNAPFMLALLAGSPATQTSDCDDVNSIAVLIAERGSPRPTSGCDLGAYDGERILLTIDDHPGIRRPVTLAVALMRDRKLVVAFVGSQCAAKSRCGRIES